MYLPQNSWTAVVQGAVVCGIEKAAISEITTATHCRRSYCIVVKEAFSPIADTTTQQSAQNRAEEQLIWLLDEGQLVLSDAPIVVCQSITMVLRKQDRTGELELFSYKDQDGGPRPTRYKNRYLDFSHAATLRFDLSKYPSKLSDAVLERVSGIKYHRLRLNVFLRLNGNVLRASIELTGAEVCVVDNIVY
jgi:predicted DCC family thiol-disulfide oxidoreductase YuxK